MTSLTKSHDGSLNAQDELFCLAMVAHFDPARAWLESHKDAKANPKYATIYAHRLLKKPVVRQRLQELADQKIEKANVQADRIIGELERIAFFDPSQFVKVDETGQPYIDLRETPADARCLLNMEFGIGVTKDGAKVRTYKVKPHDKLEAIEKLLKLHQLYKGEDLTKQPTAIQVNVHFPLPGGNWRNDTANRPDIIDAQDV